MIATCDCCGGTKKHPHMVYLKIGTLSYQCVDWFHAIVEIDCHIVFSDITDDPNLYLGNPK